MRGFRDFLFGNEWYLLKLVVPAKAGPSDFESQSTLDVTASWVTSFAAIKRLAGMPDFLSVS